MKDAKEMQDGKYKVVLIYLIDSDKRVAYHFTSY